MTRQLTELMQKYSVQGKQVHDANIIATMLANNISCLLTHNTKDFIRFEGITIEGIAC